MLDLHAAVGDRCQPRSACQRIGLGVGHAQLLPQALRADGDGLLGNGQHIGLAAEHVHHVNFERDVDQRRVAPLAQHLARAAVSLHGVARVDRHDAPAVLLHVFGSEVAGPVPFGGQAHHSNGAAVAQDAAQGVGIVVHGCGAI
jgi:hypothetical protein